MTILKPILLAVVAAAVSVCASPLSVDSTATSIVGAPLSQVDARSDASPLFKRGGPCDQGQCPDLNAAFDLYAQHVVIPPPPVPNGGGPIIMWYYYGRWNDCGQCGQVITSADGCFDFTSCSRKQTICIDTHHARAHRIWHDNGHKTCYSASARFLSNCGASITDSTIWAPTGEVACTW